MKWNSLITKMFILLSVTSCGVEIGEFSTAPQTQDQAGLIASCTTRAQAESLSQTHGVSFRVLNEKRKLIEFVGISQEELQAQLPQAKFKQNTVYNEVLISGDFTAQNVTDQEFYGAHSPQYGSTSSNRYFPHLSQIDATNNTTHLGEGVVIAIIDTGVSYNHPHLSPNILTSSDTHGSNGDSQDSDGNGHADDYVGWDFYNNDAYPMDDNGHGTHVAGLAASTYMGIAPKAKILPVKVLSGDGSGDLGTITAGILYALDKGADIVNLSLGGSSGGIITSEVQALINSVKFAKTRDALIIAAAGNGGTDGVGDCNDSEPVYPANISETNVISVASVDLYNNITSYSNFGIGSVHVAAPGGDQFTGGLLSTGVASCFGPCSSSEIPYRNSSGTSMAAPIVAGLAAVIKSADSSLSHSEIRNIILNSGDKLENLSDSVQSASVVNVMGALEQI